MQVTETLVENEIHVTKFMPELVSVDELLMLAEGYKQRIEELTTTLHLLGKGTDQHQTLSDDLYVLIRRRRYLVKTARHRQKLERELAPATAKGKR